ncbi:hypothetical protein [Flaviaesturariibacter terrae]
MTTNWKELALQLGSLRDDGSEIGGDNIAQAALERILGTEWVASAVDQIVTFKPGSELAMNCLRLICSYEAANYAFSIYKSSKGDRAGRAVWLIKHIAHPDTIYWVDEFLGDENVAHWGLGLLDQLVWCDRITDPERATALLEKAAGLYNGALASQVELIRSNLTPGNIC